MPGMKADARVDSHFIQLKGGLDEVSAATLVREGYLIAAQNYEIDSINGGYARINGYERFDGQASPSDANYWQLSVNVTGAIVAGDTVSGATASGVVLATATNLLVLADVTGTFVNGENLLVGGTVQGTAASTASLNSATDAATDAAYSLLAANNQRDKILVVPGAGPILGVWLYNDVVYAWRNDALSPTKSVMYQATASGWQAVPMYKEIAFNTGLVKPAEGATLYGNTSTATGTVKRVITRTGSWGSNAQGYIVIEVTSGTFQSAETLKLTNGAGAVQCTSASVASDVSFQPNGSFEFVNYNFTGSSSNFRMYGCDGKNPAFEFDGTILCFIRTGMTVDTPTHITAHNNYLFLSFKSSVQNSGVGDPYSWSLLTGASEIGAGEEITNLLSQPGNSGTSALSIFTKTSTKTLYGKTPSDWRLEKASPTTGGIAKTAQYIGAAFALAERGIQHIASTDRFGDFQFSTITGLIQPTINRLANNASASTVYKERNQYRIFYTNGVGLAITVLGDKPIGTMLVYYANPVTCYVTGNKYDGEEYSWFGSDDGYVYQDNKGNNFDGQNIEAWLRLPFHHFGSPRHIKTFRRATLDLIAKGYSGFSVGHELNGGSSDAEPGVTEPYSAQGGYWDQFSWDSFTWDAAAVLSPVYCMYGTEKNISLIFYSDSNLYATHSIQGVHFDYTVRRLARA